MLKLYGIAQSRTFRPLWLLHELGLEFEHVPLDFRGEALNDPAYRALNPNGRIPTLVDGDLVLWESMAINLYLARRYGGDSGLWPDSIEGEALALQWSFWVMTEVESALLSVLMHSRVLPEDKRDPDKVSRNLGVLKAPFKILDQALDRARLPGRRALHGRRSERRGGARPGAGRYDLRWKNIRRWMPGWAAVSRARHAKPRSSPE